MITSRYLLGASFAFLLSACSSVPVHYHTLLAPQMETSSTQAEAPFLLNVLPVGIPAQLDQSYLVVRQGTSGIAILDNERWASAFGDEVRTALSAQLTNQLATRDIAGLASPTGKPVITVKVQIRRFDAWPNGEVQLDATWSLGVSGVSNLSGDAGNTHRLGHVRLSEAAPGDDTALVNAQQDIVHQLAAHIAAEAKDWSTRFPH